MTTAQSTSQYTVRDEDLVWALPPMCGVLGAAYTWYVRPDPRSAAAAARVVERLLGLWQVEDAVAATASIAAAELVSSAVEHSAPPLALELARGRGLIALAVRSASPAAPPADLSAYVAENGLTLADALVEDLFLAPVPDGDGTAVVVHIRETALAPAPGAAEPATADGPATLQACGV
ncbi:hypothetical protein [Streptomyces griseorubiginosus]|uniref:hypothetical protein n=1 Tax=Streptomyces griseorubiginosus TaxID=67304 RepID=UPI002E807658|nr:hypothetical protein [Streptomyces griseorubiginosus]WUB49798.1 hypothetical protein OHN19_43290 [Streptomyces griseorubiginosus]WUB58327.1 hypothetical protein OG942_43305 [Streptomyces griseorubiginosus]